MLSMADLCILFILVQHGGLDYVRAEDPDIFCCQEVKCDKSKIPAAANLKGYHCYWLSGAKQGYSGTGLLSKTEPIRVTYEFSKKYSTEGRAIIAEYDKFILINTCEYLFLIVGVFSS